jgi:hypothetical protein
MDAGDSARPYSPSVTLIARIVLLALAWFQVVGNDGCK